MTTDLEQRKFLLYIHVKHRLWADICGWNACLFPDMYFNVGLFGYRDAAANYELG